VVGEAYRTPVRSWDAALASERDEATGMDAAGDRK
jgi:hypothetical protein